MREQPRHKDREITQEAPSQDDADFAEEIVEEASRMPDEAEIEAHMESSDQLYDEARERGQRGYR
jgi:ubiquinone biosynthesis protein UbiJ